MTTVEVSQLELKVDDLTWRALADPSATPVEAALLMNPGVAAELAASGHVLALGRRVALPEPDRAPRTIATVQLWD